MNNKDKLASGVVGICATWVIAILVLGFLPLRFHLDGVQTPGAGLHRGTETAEALPYVSPEQLDPAMHLALAGEQVQCAEEIR